MFCWWRPLLVLASFSDWQYRASQLNFQEGDDLISYHGTDDDGDISGFRTFLSAVAIFGLAEAGLGMLLAAPLCPTVSASSDGWLGLRFVRCLVLLWLPCFQTSCSSVDLRSITLIIQSIEADSVEKGIGPSGKTFGTSFLDIHRNNIKSQQV